MLFIYILCFYIPQQSQIKRYAERTADKVYYTEGCDIGYRYFVREEKPVLFPFGFGLSYSDFQYEDLNIVDCGETLEVYFAIANQSEMDGKEIAQLYIGRKETNLYELKGYTKVFVPAHSKVDAKIVIEKSILKNYDACAGCWRDYEGIYELCVGKNCTDFSLREEIVLKGAYEGTCKREE